MPYQQKKNKMLSYPPQFIPTSELNPFLKLHDGCSFNTKQLRHQTVYCIIIVTYYYKHRRTVTKSYRKAPQSCKATTIYSWGTSWTRNFLRAWFDYFQLRTEQFPSDLSSIKNSRSFPLQSCWSIVQMK